MKSGLVLRGKETNTGGYYTIRLIMKEEIAPEDTRSFFGIVNSVLGIVRKPYLT